MGAVFVLVGGIQGYCSIHFAQSDWLTHQGPIPKRLWILQYPAAVFLYPSPTSSSACLLLSTLISCRAQPLQCKYSLLPILFQLTFLQLLVDANGCNNHISCTAH